MKRLVITGILCEFAINNKVHLNRNILYFIHLVEIKHIRIVLVKSGEAKLNFKSIMAIDIDFDVLEWWKKLDNSWKKIFKRTIDR